MENVYDETLKKLDLNYEELNPQEQETYNKANFATQSLSLGDIKKYISHMKTSVALQLSDTPISEDWKITVLQARLKNYILLEAFILSPERAEEALKKQIDLKDKLGK